MASESRYGLDYIVENPEYTQKLAAGEENSPFSSFHCD